MFALARSSLAGIKLVALCLGLGPIARAQETSPAVARTGFELVPAPEIQVPPGRATVGGQAQPVAPARPAATPPQPGIAPGRQPSGPAAGTAAPEQQIEFDRNGLVKMHVNELDVRQLLELLSRRSGLNILVSPKVSGNITANFENTSVDQVLKAVIKLAGLVEKKEGSIHYLYTKGEIDDDAEIVKREKILTRVYRLNYVRSDELLRMITPFLSTDVGKKRVAVTPSYRFGIGESATFVSGGAGAASAGGGGASTSNTGGPTNQGASGGGATVGGYQPPTGGNSNSDNDMLIIQDYESNLKIIDQIIKRVDTRPVQVLIEAVIISVDLERARQLGVNFALVDNLGTALGEIGSGTSLNNNVGFNPTQLLTTAGKIAGVAGDPTGLAGAANGAKFGFVANNVTGFVQALETIGSTKILASPRILVLNKQRAEIQLGSRLGFQTFSQNFTSTIQQVQFLNTGTLLRIRPFISQDGMIRMEIHPERSSGSVTNNIPNQQTAELTTNVMVPDGATLVIGGLMEDEDDYQLQGLPGLARIPALGFLFGFRQKNEGRRELVVLLTPHIWSPDIAMAYKVDPNLDGNDPDALPAADTESKGDGSQGPVPAIAPLPAGASRAVPPSIAEREVAVLAATPTPASPGSPGLPPGARTPLPNSPPAAQPTQDSRTPRRGVLSSFWQRVTGRNDTPRLEESRQRTAGASPGPTPDPRRNDRNLIAPDPDASPANAQSRAVTTDSAPPPQMAVPVAQADPVAVSRRGVNRPDNRIVRTSADSRPTTTIEPPTLSDRSAAVGARRHTTREGESFASIAQSYYGSTRYDSALWWINRRQVNWPDQLAPGDRLIIPPAREIQTTLDQLGRARTRAPAVRPTSPRKLNPQRAPKTAPEPRASSAPRPDLTSGGAARAHAADSPPSSPDGGWVPAHPARPSQPSAGWVPVQPRRSTPSLPLTPPPDRTNTQDPRRPSEPAQDAPQ
jgi:general secretion pathway protein D